MKKEIFLKILYICLAIIVIAFTINYIYFSIDSKINNVYAQEISPSPSGNGAVYTDSYIQKTESFTNYIGLAVNPLNDSTEEGWSALSYTTRTDFKYKPMRNYFNSTWADIQKTNIEDKGYKRIVIDNKTYYSFNFSLTMNYNSLQVVNTNYTELSGYPIRYLYIYFVVDNVSVAQFDLLSNSNKTQYILYFRDFINGNNKIYYLHDPYDSTESYSYFNITLPSEKFTRFTFRDESYVLNISDSTLTNSQIINLYTAFNSSNYNYIYGVQIQDAYNEGYKQAEKNVQDYWQNYYSEEIDKAYENGKIWGLNHSTDTAWGSTWDFIASSFNGVGNILNIELLPNVPLWTFIAIPLLFGIITLIYKLIGG